jgi:zinc transport system ATP-binding protein
MSALVEISNLDFSYGDQAVLRQVNLSIPAGTTLGLIGPNGGGKTTLIRLLLGLEKPTRGTIRIAGLSPAAAVRRGDVLGYLPQNPHVPANFPLNVRQVVDLGLAGKTGMFYRADHTDRDFTRSLLNRVGIAELAERPVGALSGGQLQRVLIARALAARPKLLLLDEPTTGIDRTGQQRFIEFIDGLKRELALTVVFVSHDLRAVSAMSDRIGCLNVTLHYHEVTSHLPVEQVYQRFACDLEAIGGGSCGVADHAADVTAPVELRVLAGQVPRDSTLP